LKVLYEVSYIELMKFIFTNPLLLAIAALSAVIIAVAERQRLLHDPTPWKNRDLEFRSSSRSNNLDIASSKTGLWCG